MNKFDVKAVPTLILIEDKLYYKLVVKKNFSAAEDFLLNNRGNGKPFEFIDPEPDPTPTPTPSPTPTDQEPIWIDNFINKSNEIITCVLTFSEEIFQYKLPPMFSNIFILFICLLFVSLIPLLIKALLKLKNAKHPKDQ